MSSCLFPVPRRMATVLLGCSLAATIGLSACSSHTSSPSMTIPSTGSASSASSSPVAQASAGSLQQLKQVARRLAGDFEAGHMDTTMAMAGPQARAAGLSTSVLSTARNQIDTQAGPFQSIIGTFATAQPTGNLVEVVTQHTRHAVRILYSFTPGTTSLNGINLNLATAREIARAKATPTSGSSIGPTGPDALDTQVSVGSHQLPGILATPRGTAQPIAVLLLPGSGPQDADETIGTAHNKPMRDIAEGLATAGITSLRFDKRTQADPASFTTSSTINDEYLDDATAAVKLLAGRRELHGYKLYVIAHSQAAMLLPTILHNNPQLAGGVSLAGSPRSLFDVLYDQQAAQITATTPNPVQRQQRLALARRTMNQAKAITRPTQAPPAGLGGTLSAAYIASLNALNPVATARSIHNPLLFLQGDADTQISPTTDYDAWKADLAGRPDTAFHDYPHLNHLFMPTTGKPAPADYDAPNHVSPTVIHDITTWLLHP